MTVTKCTSGLIVLMLASLSVVWAQSSAGPAASPAAPVTTQSTNEKPPAAAPPVAAKPDPTLPVTSVPASRTPAATTPPADSRFQSQPESQPKVQEPEKSGDSVYTESRVVDGEGNETHSLRLKQPAGSSIGIYRELNKRLDPNRVGQVQLAVDSRTNSIIIRGRPEQVDAVKKIIAELAFRVSAEPPGATNPNLPAMVADPQPGVTYSGILLNSPPTVTSSIGFLPASPAQTFQLAEQEAAEAAREYRQGAERHGPDHPTQKALRDRVASLVEKAFEVRQEVQQKELEQLKQRLNNVERTVTKRAQHRDQIINKRVDELLSQDEALNWNANGLTPTPVTAPHIPSSPYRPPTYSPSAAPIYRDPMLQSPSGFTPYPTPPNPQTWSPDAGGTPNSVRPAQAAPAASPGMPAGFDLRRALRESARRVWQLEQSRDALKASDTGENLSRNSAYQRGLVELKRMQEEHADLLQEANANLQLLQLDLDSATAALQAAEEELDVYRKNVERGVVPTSGVAPLEAKAKQAASSVERARILLELQRQAIQDASLDRASTDSPQPVRAPEPFEDESSVRTH